MQDLTRGNDCRIFIRQVNSAFCQANLQSIDRIVRAVLGESFIDHWEGVVKKGKRKSPEERVSDHSPKIKTCEIAQNWQFFSRRTFSFISIFTLAIYRTFCVHRVKSVSPQNYFDLNTLRRTYPQEHSNKRHTAQHDTTSIYTRKTCIPSNK